MEEREQVVIEVPATSANLGPGFDALGLAVALKLRVRATRSSTDSFHYQGEGTLPDSPDNLMHYGFRAACRAAGIEPFPVRFDVRNPIPLARGLGSSSAALVAGAVAADRLAGSPLGRDGVFEVTTLIEGHPDNVAPAIYGGFTVSARDADGRFRSRSLPLPARWRLLFAVPPFELATEKARALLPQTYSRQDLVATSSRTAMWALAVARDEPELLRAASIDVLHQPYRAPLLPGFEHCLDEAFAAGAYAAYLSGAGPSVGAVAGEDEFAAVREALGRYAGDRGRVLVLQGSAGYEVGAAEDVSVLP